jgi:uncharacterized membrane protein
MSGVRESGVASIHKEKVMRVKGLVLALIACIVLLAVAPAMAARKPPKDETPPPPAVVDGFYFWKLGHMDGPHDSSKALGISRDGKVAVGSTVVVDFIRAWRMDVDWALATDDAIPPLYNELQVQENVGGEAAYAASNMTTTTCGYDKVALNLDCCGSFPVGTLTTGKVSYAAEWLWAYEHEATEPNSIVIPDFGGGISDMVANDVSADGLILVGTGNVKTGAVAFRADTTVLDAEGVPIPKQLKITDFVTLQSLQTSSAQAVSADGMIIAGFGAARTGNKAFVTYVLDASTDPITIESYLLPALDGGRWSEAYAMTPDGLYIAGRSDSPRGPQACIWFQGDDPNTPEVETWVAKGLGGLSKKKYNSMATGIVQRPGAADGDLLVVGWSQSILYPSEAFVWSGNPVLGEDVMADGVPGYLYDLEYILIKTGAGEASAMGSSWILNQATGIALNADLTARIVGWGINPEGGVEAWLVAEYPLEAMEPLFTKE